MGTVRILTMSVISLLASHFNADLEFEAFSLLLQEGNFCQGKRQSDCLKAVE
jgi:hypothetical protein